MASTEPLVPILSHPITQSILLQNLRQATGFPLHQHVLSSENGNSTSTTPTSTSTSTSTNATENGNALQREAIAELGQLIGMLQENQFDETMLRRLLRAEDMEFGGRIVSGIVVDDHFDSVLKDPESKSENNNASGSAVDGDIDRELRGLSQMTQQDVDEYVMKQAAVQQICDADLEMMDLVFEKYTLDLETELRIPPSLASSIKKEEHNSPSPHGEADDDYSLHLPFSPGSSSQRQSSGILDGALDDLFDPSDVGSKRPEDVIDELKRKYSEAELTEHFAMKKKKNFSKDVTTYLNQWFFDHLADPYPTEDEKKRMLDETGLSIIQINNWLGNKRMRYKRKKMQELNRKGNQKKKNASSSARIDFANDDGNEEDEE